MTVQGISPAGKNPFALPPVGKGKSKADENPAESGFASLLAALVVPSAGQAPGLLALAAGGEEQPPGLIDGAPALPVAPGNGTPAITPPVLPAPKASGGTPATFGQMLQEAVQANQEGAGPGLAGNPPELPESPPTPVAEPEVPVAPVGSGPAEAPVAPVTDGEAAPPAMATPGDGTDLVDTAQGETPHPDAGPTTETVGNTDAPGQAQSENEHLSSPVVTRGLERGAEVSRLYRPADRVGGDRLPIPPASQTTPADPVAPPPAEPELPPSLEALRSERHEPARLMEAISRAVNQTRDGNYTVHLRLHPEHLGEVRLQLHLSGREVHTVLEVASPEARQQLESRGDQLRQSLNQAGLTLSGFQVSTGQRQSARDRREPFEEQFRQIQGGVRRIQPAASTPAGAMAQIKGAGRRSGRLDTMA